MACTSGKREVFDLYRMAAISVMKDSDWCVTDRLDIIAELLEREKLELFCWQQNQKKEATQA